MPSTVWIAAFYMFAPIPFDANSPYRGRRRWRGLFYYISQTIMFSVIQRFSDMVFVTNDLDRLRFIDRGTAPDRIFTIWGGVDNKLTKLAPDKTERVYDAVFIGRLHPQKGILQLVDIWKRVCLQKKDAKLAVIGDGELEEELRKKITTYGLSQNITLFGFRDGREKIAIFKDSSIVVHPATYDSGGMAACEAMACGLPGVSFDLPSLRVYYPKGMLKAPCFDLDAFASDILNLVDDKDLYRRLQSEALEFALEMDWDARSKSAMIAMLPILAKPLGGA
jgi:glycosyltransferase involved in cell wall biosynthesis